MSDIFDQFNKDEQAKIANISIFLIDLFAVEWFLSEADSKYGDKLYCMSMIDADGDDEPVQRYCFWSSGKAAFVSMLSQLDCLITEMRKHNAVDFVSAYVYLQGILDDDALAKYFCDQISEVAFSLLSDEQRSELMSDPGGAALPIKH